MKHVCISMTLCLLLMACSNEKDFAYNEVAADKLLRSMDIFDRSYDDFLKGEYKTKFESDASVSFGTTTAEKIRDLKSNLSDLRDSFSKLEPTDNAKEFHAKVDEYLKLINEDYIAQLEAYAEIDCSCYEPKSSIASIVNEIKDRASLLADESLEAQKRFFEKAGLKAK